LTAEASPEPEWVLISPRTPMLIDGEGKGKGRKESRKGRDGERRGGKGIEDGGENGTAMKESVGSGS